MNKKKFSLEISLFLLFAIILTSGCIIKPTVDENVPDDELTEPVEQTVFESPITTLSSDELVDELTQILAEKFIKKTNEISVKISQSNSEHLRGTFEFEGLSTPKVFFAINIDGELKVIYTSEPDVISCEEIGYYNFPAEMTTDCIAE